MQFRTINDLYNDILRNVWKLPSDIDLVVGVPRSGMLAATMISLILNRPLVDFDGFLRGDIFRSGSTRKRSSDPINIRHALIVDDSSHTGSAMLEVVNAIAKCDAPLPMVTTCVVYGTSHSNSTVDVVLDIVKSPRIFEWNVMHHPTVLGNACVDIDGVLCHDPSEQENDDGDNYRDFLLRAKPLYLPSHRIKQIVTSRLEKYRKETEAWLSSYCIYYDSLVMLDLPSARERRKLGAHARHKASIYSSSSATLFIESDINQAWTIARESGKPVLSIQGPMICEASSWSPNVVKQRLTNKRLLSQWLRSVLGDSAVNWLGSQYKRRKR